MPALAPLNTTTVADIVKDALLDLGAIGENEKLSANTIEHGRRLLNRMLDAWNAERLTVYAIQLEEFPLVSTQQSYSVGPGGDFDTVRPPRIEYAFWRNTLALPQPADYPIRLLNDEEWAEIPIKGLQGSNPWLAYYQPTFPLGTFNVWTVPNQVTNVLLGTWTQFSKFTSVSDPISFPPAYEEAIVSHLTVRLAPSYGKSVSAETVQIAKTAKANLKRMNLPAPKLRCDSALVGRHATYDIRINDSRR